MSEMYKCSQCQVGYHNSCSKKKKTLYIDNTVCCDDILVAPDVAAPPQSEKETK